MNAPLAVTMGEPAGVGGEITLAAWRDTRARRTPFFLIDDPDRVSSLAAALGVAVPVEPIGHPAEAHRVFARALPVLPLSRRVPLALGRASARQAGAVLEAIDTAVSLCRTGEASGLVTNPIHKAALLEAGFPHAGHTDYLARLAGVPRTVMMLAAPALRVVPVTVHIPLSEVPQALTRTAIVETARIVDAALRAEFGVPAPRLAVAGLNPHAGEDGRIGTEEREVIAPALQTLRNEGIDVTGPLSADTMFYERARAHYDAALCMYHDQALIPIKTLAFDDGVNVTLGLPFVRTSPDHGTALAIAGRGEARPDSLIAALTLAADLAARRNARIAA